MSGIVAELADYGRAFVDEDDPAARHSGAAVSQQGVSPLPHGISEQPQVVCVQAHEYADAGRVAAADLKAVERRKDPVQGKVADDLPLVDRSRQHGELGDPADWRQPVVA